VRENWRRWKIVASLLAAATIPSLTHCCLEGERARDHRIDASTTDWPFTRAHRMKITAQLREIRATLPRISLFTFSRRERIAFLVNREDVRFTVHSGVLAATKRKRERDGR